MIAFQVGMVAATLLALVGAFFMKSKIGRAALIAFMSLVLMVQMSVMNWMAKQFSMLMENVQVPSKAENPELFKEVLTIFWDYYTKNHQFIDSYNFLFWVLLVFIVLAPFVMQYGRHNRRVIVVE